MLTRRQFLAASLGAAGASALGVGLYTWQIEPHWVEWVRRPLPIERLPKDLAGRTLVQLSDLHVGPQVADEYILDTFRRVNDLAPDIIAYTGDYTTYTGHFPTYNREVYAHAESVYAQPPKGRLATVGILGNHDYGPNWRHAEIADRFTEILQAVGIEMLRNAIADVAGLQIVGMDDIWGRRRFRPEESLAALDPSRAALVLSHNPDTVDRPGWGNYRGWILAGHTHGGQCKPPFLPPPLLPVENRRYTSGEFDLWDGRRMYISRGVGHLMQARFNARPEVTVFELQPGVGSTWSPR